MDYLLCYRSTKHPTTGKSPAELMFGGRIMRDKLPQWGMPMEADEEVIEKDKEMKEKGKEYIDKRRGAKPNAIKVGDTVLVKEMVKRNKMTP